MSSSEIFLFLFSFSIFSLNLLTQLYPVYYLFSVAVPLPFQKFLSYAVLFTTFYFLAISPLFLFWRMHLFIVFIFAFSIENSVFLFSLLQLLQSTFLFYHIFSSLALPSKLMFYCLLSYLSWIFSSTFHIIASTFFSCLILFHLFSFCSKPFYKKFYLFKPAL